jgi:hypothetical protein
MCLWTRVALHKLRVIRNCDDEIYVLLGIGEDTLLGADIVGHFLVCLINVKIKSLALILSVFPLMLFCHSLLPLDFFTSTILSLTYRLNHNQMVQPFI